MATLKDIDPHNPNIIKGTDWGLIPIPQNYSDLYKHYGDPTSPTFFDDYLIIIPHTITNGQVIQVVSHIAMVTALHDVFATCQKDIKDYGGCHVYREVRGSTTHLSLHSWGLAIDLNVDNNPLGSANRSNQPQTLIDCFKKHGFFWGADYHHRKDPMHFQRAGDF